MGKKTSGDGLIDKVEKYPQIRLTILERMTGTEQLHKWMADGGSQVSLY